MKVTIITVNLNGNRFLKEAIDSVLMQESIDLEYLVIDGGSTDGSLETIVDAAARECRIKWVSEPDSGIADAMNKGTALANGDLVGFLHADDFYPETGVLARVAAAFERSPGAVWATGGASLVDDAGTVLKEIGVRRYSFRRLLRSNIIIHPSTFVRRPVLIDVGGFNRSFRYAMDYDLWLRLGSISAPLPVDGLLSNFRLHSGSCSSSNPDGAFEEEYYIRTAYLKRTGGMLWPHKTFYLIKKPFNRLFYSRYLNRMSESG